MQCRLATTADQLKKLGDELDFPYPAHTNLYVVEPVAFGGVGAYLAMQVTHLLDGRIVVIAPVDKWFHEVFEFSNGIGVASNGARLEPGVSLPGPCLRDEVIFQGGQAADQRAAGSKWPQTHVYPEYKTVFIDMIKRTDDTLTQFAMKFMP